MVVEHENDKGEKAEKTVATHVHTPSALAIPDVAGPLSAADAPEAAGPFRPGTATC